MYFWLWKALAWELLFLPTDWTRLAFWEAHSTVYFQAVALSLLLGKKACINWKNKVVFIFPESVSLESLISKIQLSILYFANLKKVLYLRVKSA